jgi:hypothetical protein
MDKNMRMIFTDAVLQEAMIKEANFINELNLANVQGILGH